MYRESDAQTDPYTPDYVVPEGTDPEVLTLASLNFKAGLPAGLTEVQMIERARQKREFEASLPPSTDEASLALRRKMMSEQEMREWNTREQEILGQHEETLAAFEAQLRSQAEARELHWDERIEHARQIKLTEKDKDISQIQRRRIKALRKLSEARKTVEAEKKPRDIVTEYADYSSEQYAPLTRNGYITRDKLAHNYETKPLQLESLAGLVALEAAIPLSVTEVQVQRPNKGKKPCGYTERSAARMQEQLNRMDSLLKAAKLAKPSEREQNEALLAAYRETKPVERPPTPTVMDSDPDEAVELASILLQRLLRGRAIQNMMYEGKERRRDLIEELRSEEGQEKPDTSAAQAAESIAKGLHGEIVGSSLDDMAKELVRFKEERRIAELVGEAERERHAREAVESARRAEDLTARREQDEVFRQMNAVHQNSAGSYIDEIVSDVVAKEAAAGARAEAKLQEQRLEGIVARLEERQSSAAAITSDIVDQFLFPEVERQQERREVLLEERKFGNATDKAIGTMLATVASAFDETEQ